MIRLFDAHKIRRCKELEGYWEFTPVTEKKIPIKYPYKLFVPGCWENNIQFADYRGFGVYRKLIKLEEQSNIRLIFKGVSHTADVYLDKKHIAHHYNAFTEFNSIVQNLEAGEHEIVVMVDNTFSDDSSLHIPNDYYSYGGLTRPVILEKVESTFIKYIHFTPIYVDNLWRAKVDICIKNIDCNKSKVKVNLLLNDTAMPEDTYPWIEMLPCSEMIVSETVSFENIMAWSCRDPKLYLLTTLLYKEGIEEPIDDLIERVGFRIIEAKNGEIRLNGEKIFIQGFNRHEDHANAGCSIPIQLAATDIDLLKDMGSNAVRTCHYPNDERFLDMCDEKGLMVWEENHARGFELEQMKNPNFEKQCEDCIREMIESHYNHPSIVIWGILNECASDTEEGRRMYQKQFSQIKELDKSRPLTFATKRHYKDICFDLVDIVSINIYFGWYDERRGKEEIQKEFERYLKWIDSTAGQGKPIIISEFGGGAIYGCHNPYATKWSEERQAEILKDTLSVYLNNSKVCGTLIWQLCDCRVTDEIWGIKRPRTMNNKGVVDEYRRPKKAYSIVKKLYKKNFKTTKDE